MTTATGNYEILYGLREGRHYAKLYENGSFVRGKAPGRKEGLSIIADVLQPLVDVVPQEATVRVNPIDAQSAESLGRQVKIDRLSLLDRIIQFDLTPKNNV